MHKFKGFFILFILSFFIITSLYLGTFYAIPKLINSQILNNKIEKIIKDKTNANIDIKGIKINITPNLKADIYLKEISIPQNNQTALKINNTKAKLNIKNLSATNLEIESVYADLNLIQQFLSKLKKGKTSKPFALSKLPEITIHKADIILNKQPYQKFSIQNIELKNQNLNRKNLTFKAFYEIPNISKNIEIGQKGNFYIENNSIYAEKFLLNTDNSEFYLNGKVYAQDRTNDFSLQAKDIPVDKSLQTLLYYQKSKDKSKKFIENFKDYSGQINIDLYVKNNDISGKLLAKNLSAKSVLFNVPISFSNAKFILKDNTLTSNAEGLLGGEKVYHSLLIKDILSPKRIVIGKVTSTLTEKMIKTYLPETYHLKNTADAKVIYKIQNRIPEVKYYLKLNKGSDVIYKNAYLGLRKKQRILYAKTIKIPNGLKLQEYEYYILEPNEKQLIVKGEGLFIKQNGKLTPKFVTCKTQNYAPVSVAGSFGKYVNGGKFKGNLKYDFIKDKITGNFEIVKTIFNDFYVRSAKVNANLDRVDIIAQGRYKFQPFESKMTVANRLDGIFIVHNMEILIDKFIINKKSKRPVDTNISKHHAMFMNRIDNVSSKITKIDMTIEKWNIKVKEFIFDDLELNDIQLFGSLKDSLFNFTMPEVLFANGMLSAEGQYNFNDNSSIIDFSAREIDSNIAAEKLFNLKNQIQGIAQAKLHLQTQDNLQEVLAHIDFEMEEGFLPQLGSTEFMLGKANKKRKISMYDLTNIDFTRKDALNSDIRGSFDLNNQYLENINITSQQKFMSLYINGQYNIIQQDAEMNIFGKYDKEAPKGIRVLFLPLSWVLKFVLRPEESMEIYKNELAKIPPIETKKCKFQYFRVNLKGNLNNPEDIKIILKRIK